MTRHVYVHVPFCARRCSYCDFSIAVRPAVPLDEYLRALRLELAAVEPGGVDTIYMGGGTPSRLGAEGVSMLMQLLQQRYLRANDAEITLEANPEDVTATNLAAWRGVGVNRLSIGVQSFDDEVLAWMHRVHDAASAARAVRLARESGFVNVSLDLIFALPRELRRDWRADLEAAVELGPDHVSLYGLTVEPRTPLARWRDRGACGEVPDEAYEEEYLLAHELLAAAGYEHYEVSNFAKPLSRSRHNQAYWKLVPYSGHGPSAHSFDGRMRAWNEPAYARWVARLDSGESAVEDAETLTPEQRELERVYLSLRTRGGLPMEEIDASVAAVWVRSGWAEMTGDRLRLTATGWLRLDALTSVLTGPRSPCNV